MSIDTLPGDIRRLILSALNYRTIQALLCTCKLLNNKIRDDELFWKNFKIDHLTTTEFTHSQPYYLSIKWLMTSRWNMAVEIINLVFNAQGQIYGGFVRDYISQRKMFTDIDIHFYRYGEFIAFKILMDEHFKMILSNIVGSTDYHSSNIDSGIHAKYKVIKNNMILDIDVKYGCTLATYDGDFDINYFVLSSVTHECEYVTPIGKIRHLDYNYEQYPSHCSDDPKLWKITNDRYVRMQDDFKEIYEQCRAGKFKIGRGFNRAAKWQNEYPKIYADSYKKYQVRLMKMLDYGYILIKDTK